MTQEEFQQAKDGYIAHLQLITTAFNDWADAKGLKIHMNADKMIDAVVNNHGVPTKIVRFHSRVDDTGIIHVTQLKTVIDCFIKLLNSPLNCGHVLGAMQSGKTTTSLALQWAGPALYLLTGTRTYPFYLISSQTNHEDQTTSELEAFLRYYGDIEIVSTENPSPDLDAVFISHPTLSTYRDHILSDVSDVFNVPHLGDEIYRRVGGDVGIRRVAERCLWATGLGYRPLMIIDEPQYGASDRMVNGEAGLERFPCVLAQIFNRIEQFLGTERRDHWFVGLSATPFELNDLSRVWEVKQYLSLPYSGYNFFNGEEISPDVTIIPPVTIGQTRFANQIGVPFLAQVSTAAYYATASAYDRFARKIGYAGSQLDYRQEVVETLRVTIYNVINSYAESEHPVGLCIRAFNNNNRTLEFINNLRLDQSRIEVLNYYGNDATGASIKRIISQRHSKQLPYLIFVTSRARMADAFPVDVRFFMDFSQKASDLNALLQGLLGRACGYGKRSTVVLSDQNIGIIDAYVATTGGYVHRTSRHTVTVGGFRRGAPTSMIKLNRDMDDVIVRLFFEQMDELVGSILSEGKTSIKGLPRSKSAGFRTGPILSSATALGLFDHIEQPVNRAKLFPQIPTGFKIARSHDQVKHTRREGVFLKYAFDPEGDNRYTFRWSSREDGAQGGAQGRARGQHDAAGLDTHMEPTIYVEKFNAATGEIIYDRHKPVQLPGKWRAFMVTFPLVDPVREINTATIALPNETCVYDSQMTEEERELRNSAALQ